jgi:Trk K+ transport system NAD-binding subunit
MLPSGDKPTAMRSRGRRFRANLLYLRKPLREFLPILLGTAALIVAGGLAFEQLYTREPLSFRHALYITYCLLFLEHLLPFPEHWLLQVFYVALPPIGLAVVLDGIVRFSFHILRRDETSGEWMRAMSHTMKDHVVLFGLGKLGIRVLPRLLEMGELVVAVEKDPRCPHLGIARQHGVPVLIGSGREPDIFDKLNLGDAKSIVLVTDDDLANLEIALDARKVKPEIRVVLRMFDQELAAKIKDAFDIQLAFSTSELAAPLFAAASIDRSIVNSFYVGERLFVVARLHVKLDSELIGKNTAWLHAQYGAFVLEVRRGAETIASPDAEARFAAGDRLIVQADAASLRALHALAHDAAAM